MNVMGYDYTGYGCSSGEPSVAASITDLEAAYNCLLERCGHASSLQSQGLDDC